MFLVEVEAMTGEPAVLDSPHANAGLDWLENGRSTGALPGVWAYPETGGFMIVRVDHPRELGRLLARYPLRSTVRLATRPVVVPQGFADLGGVTQMARPTTGMLFLVTAEALLADPELRGVDRDQADHDWLDKCRADDALQGVWDFPEGGRILVLDVPDPAALRALLATYPRRSSVRLATRPLVLVEEGFEFLGDAIRLNHHDTPTGRWATLVRLLARARTVRSRRARRPEMSGPSGR